MFSLPNLKSRFYPAHTGRSLRRALRQSPRGCRLLVEPLEHRLLLEVAGWEYTLDADFDQGALVGGEHDTVHDQLQLSTTTQILPFI